MVTAGEIYRLGVGELAQAYRQRQLSPEQVCEQLLERIDDSGINCNAFAHVDHEAALGAARDSARRWRDGTALGLLDGIPVAIKDVLDVAGMPTRYGSAACADAGAADQDSLLAQRLRREGAVLLGKTRTWEFAWRSNVERDPREVVTNPHDPERSPGGSSGGSAAVVAAGLCPLAFGTDSGGSVRGPAGFCGVIGFKPSYAMIPVYPPSPMGDLEHIGIFARSVTDVRLVLDRVGGSHPDDPASWPFHTPLPATELDFEKLRFAYSADLNYGDPQPELRRHFSTLIERLVHSGLDLQAIDIPFRDDFEQCYDLFVPDAALTLELAPRDRRHMVDAQIVELARQASRMTALDQARAEQARAETQRMFARLFDSVDCLLTLTQETVANRLDETPRIMRQTRSFNMTGQPAISIPGAVSSEGLPIGLQLVCDRGRDDLLLSIAERIATQLGDA
jgi:Asp-tRNA(Asn)/Glu-tRNA(Gln) amidotransferase A subunit family amidase